MNILALDTASSACAMALQTGDKLFVRGEPESGRHSQHLLSMLDGLLKEAEIGVTDLHRLVWNAGPGSFTGLRIGASVLQALAYTLDLPVLSLSALEIQAEMAISRMASNFAADTMIPVAVALDARMNGVYWALFSYQAGKLKRLQDDQLLSVEQFVVQASMLLNDLCLISGDAWHHPEWLEGSSITLSECMVDAFDQYASARILQVLRLAQRVPVEAWSRDPMSCTPLYLQGDSHWKKRQRRQSVIESGIK